MCYSMCDIMWIGLSNKIDEPPLSAETISGKLICAIENKLENVITYKTNLVKYAPLNEEGKLRYPTKDEISISLPKVKDEIESINPKIVFMLGQKVTQAILNNTEKYSEFEYSIIEIDGINYVSIHHPSYISVYKRKNVGDYIDGVVNIINKILEN